MFHYAHCALNAQQRSCSNYGYLLVVLVVRVWMAEDFVSEVSESHRYPLDVSVPAETRCLAFDRERCPVFLDVHGRQ